MTVVSGSGCARQNGSQLNVTVSQAAILNWSSFDIQAGESTRFLQPSANSIVLNNIGAAAPSQIWGKLTANGSVILANSHGFYFGPNSMIQVGGSFVATTAPPPPDFGAGACWKFTGPPPLASIVNYGQIQAGDRQSLFLIAETVDNHGRLSAPGGSVRLLAGQQVLLSERPDGRGLSASVTLPSGSVDNSGKIVADAGTIALRAQVVNQNGIIQANSAQDRNGAIELVASDQLNLGANSRILARGDDSAPGSSGGTVTLKSENAFSDSAGGRIVTRGGAQGGNGGDVEVSAPKILSLNSGMDAGAQPGWSGGKFLLDPESITLGGSGAGSVDPSGTVSYDSGSGALLLNVNSAFANKNFSLIDLQASGAISLAQGTTWNLSQSTGLGGGQLTLQAGGDITFGSGSKITDANNWSVTLEAGYNFANNTIQPGVGSIYLNGGSGLSQKGSIQLSAGSVNLLAGQSILLASLNNHSAQIASGSVFTTGGGSIFAHALAGDIDAGTSNGGTSDTTQTSDYNFTASGSRPNTVLGGISTAAGGNVTLVAGNNIDSTPVVPSGKWPGASGAYGSGDVTVIAGNQINGNYMLAGGVGTLLAGVQVQSGQAGALQNPNANPAAYASTLKDLETAATQTQNPNGNIGGIEYAGGPQSSVTLSLIQGSWNAWAANNIYLKEVNNPNGTFNSAQSFLYNYAPDAAARFWAGNAIELTGGTVGGILSRVRGGNQNIVYAPGLSLNAGAGGIEIDKSIILAPSSEGSLEIITRDRGNVSGAATAGSTTLAGITMSDSDSTDYRTFPNGHAAMPLHLNDPNPVTLDISGGIQSFALAVPTFADIQVNGSTYNFGFVGRNLSPSQTTSINVAGDITYRGNFTSTSLTDPLPAALFNPSLSGDPEVANRLRYDAAAGTLTFVGQMTTAELSFLLNPAEIRIVKGQPVTVPLTLDATQQAAIQQLYAASQSASLGDQGLALAGPGQFNISARNIDLGVSGGITVQAPDAALEAISPYGANLNIAFSGNLDMASTKIANESYLGGINIVGSASLLTSAGTLDVGSQFTTYGDPNAPKGIFTTSGGDLSIRTPGDVNVDGSRIAAFNGGNITVESLAGDVSAGNGAVGLVSMNALELNPKTGRLVAIPASIPGSGILGTTLVGSHAKLGNILIETPRGNISAGAGGIVELSFNKTDSSRSTTELLAGFELQDAGGQPVSAGNLSKGKLVRISNKRNVDSSGSGVIAEKLVVKATGFARGLFVGTKADIHFETPPPPGPRLIVVSHGGARVEGPTSGPDTGPLVFSGGGPAEINGQTTASDTAGTPVAKTEALSAEDAAAVAALAGSNSYDENEKDKKGKAVVLAQKTGRVTVLLPETN